MKDDIQYAVKFVQDTLSYADALGQVAEEATELAQAALKLERVVRGTNPTPVGRVEATVKVMEETADVLNALEVAGFLVESENIAAMREVKMARWEERLRKKAAEVQHGS